MQCWAEQLFKVDMSEISSMHQIKKLKIVFILTAHAKC
jgi:hypothetical protein